MKEQFTKKEVAKGLGLTPRTIQFWTDEGLVVPEVANPRGRGKTRLYSRKNLFQLLIIRRLTDCGLTLLKTMEVMHSLKHEQYWDQGRNGALGGAGYIILYDYDTGPGTLAFHRGPGEVKLDLMNEHSTALVISTASLAERVENI